MEYDVFICYSSKDRMAADTICATLEANKIRCWMAPRDILPGMDYGDAILEAIKQCRLMVLVFSSGSNTSEHVKNEVETAVSNEKPIIPIRVENALPSGSLALHLSRRQWLDAITPPLKKHLKKLAENIKGLLSLPEEAWEKYAEAAEPPSKPALRFYPQEKAKRLVRPLFLVFLLLVAGALALAGYWYFGSRPAVPFAERDWVLITDFENHTGNEVFDKSLSTAIMVSIEQSRYVNVLPRQRIRDALQRMKKEDVVHIDEIIGREIAEREGARVMIVPSISSVGETFVLTAKIQDVGKGDVLASQIVRAGSQDEMLGALDKLTRAVRRDLGESLAAISRQGKPLARVTTSSLEALKNFSLGSEKYQQYNDEEARGYYENALRIDSTFVLAKAKLGLLHFLRFDREKGKELLAEVIQNLDGLTEGEKYSILQFHAEVVENDFEKAVQYARAVLALYPDNAAAYSNLGYFYSRLGRYDEAIDAAKESIRINPRQIGPYNSITYIYAVHLGKVDSLLVWSKRVVSKNPEYHTGYIHLGQAYLGKDSLKLAEAAFMKALEIRPDYIPALRLLAATYQLMGNYHTAIQLEQKVLELYPSGFWSHYGLGILFQQSGDTISSQEHFEIFRNMAESLLNESPEEGYHYINLGLVHTRLGEKERGLEIGQKGIEIDPDQHFGYARLLSVQGKTQEAIDQLGSAIQKGFRNYIELRINSDLQSLQNEPEFLALLEREFQ